MDSRRIGLLGGLSGLASLAALAPMMGESMRIIQRPTAKRPPKTQRDPDALFAQGPRRNRKDKAFKLKGIRP